MHFLNKNINFNKNQMKLKIENPANSFREISAANNYSSVGHHEQRNKKNHQSN